MGHEISGRLLKGMSKFRGYTVVKPVGIGGEGEVWLVHHDVLHVDFAVKVVPKSVMDADPDLRSQFAVEARISGKVRHPSLVSVYDAGFDEPTGLYYLVMDYMPDGKRERNGVMVQCIPYDELPAYREGKVFFVLHSAERINEAAIRDYFRVRNSEYVKWNMTDGKMSDSDFVGVLSKAVGKDIFVAMAQEGWKGVKRGLSRVKVDRLEKVSGFDVCQ